MSVRDECKGEDKVARGKRRCEEMEEVGRVHTYKADTYMQEGSLNETHKVLPGRQWLVSLPSQRGSLEFLEDHLTLYPTHCQQP